MAEIVSLASHPGFRRAIAARVRLRLRIERAVAALIETLDTLDGDPDLESLDEGDPLDLGEHDEAELSGIGDLDGLREQFRTVALIAALAEGGAHG